MYGPAYCYRHAIKHLEIHTEEVGDGVYAYGMTCNLWLYWLFMSELACLKGDENDCR